jgi:hypothetical protein
VDKIDSQKVEPFVLSQFRWAVLDGDVIARAALTTDPYDLFFAKDVIKSEARSRLIFDAPAITTSGSVPLTQLKYGPSFQGLVDDLHSQALRKMSKQSSI